MRIDIRGNRGEGKTHQAVEILQRAAISSQWDTDRPRLVGVFSPGRKRIKELEERFRVVRIRGISDCRGPEFSAVLLDDILEFSTEHEELILAARCALRVPPNLLVIVYAPTGEMIWRVP